MHMSLDDLKQEVTRWRHLWRLSEDGNPQTLVETLDYTNAELYPGNYVVMTTLLTEFAGKRDRRLSLCL